MHDFLLGMQRIACLDKFKLVPQALSEEQIERLLSDIETLPWQGGTVSNGAAGGATVETSIRKSKVKWIPRTQQWAWLYEIVSVLIHTANRELWDFQISGFREVTIH